MAHREEEKDARQPSPHHGSEAGAGPDQHPQQHKSVSQPDGTAAEAPRGETGADLRSQTPEGREGKLNPSAPNDATSNMPANPTRDSAGEIGEPTGRGTLDAPTESTPTASETTNLNPTKKSPETEEAEERRRQGEKRGEEEAA